MITNTRSIVTYVKTSTHVIRLFTRTLFTECLRSVGNAFSPVHFRGFYSQLVSCYAFFKWWRLLDLHPHCLRRETPFVTLNAYFGTLTPVSFVQVSQEYLTYPCWLLYYAVNKFWVGKFPVGISLCKTYPYFTSPTNYTQLYPGIFQQEPAMARFEWLFTPNPTSSKCMYTTPVRTSISLSKNFVLRRNRSSGFRSYLSD